MWGEGKGGNSYVRLCLSAALAAAAIFAGMMGIAATAAAAQAPPVISSFSPTSGLAGTTVTISGSNLENATSLLVGGVKASITSDGSSAIQATIPAGATTGVLTVTTSGGKTTTTGALTVLAVTSLAPTSGPYGTLVTVTGSGFNSGSKVLANGVAAALVKRTATELQFAWPQSATTSGPISVTNSSAPAGTVASSGSFTVTPHSPPTISSFTPSSGITGSPVTITGMFFSGASAVKFGARSASFTVDSATQITATVPNGTSKGPISVTTAVGKATSSTSFIPTLSVTGVSPSAATAGTPVTISGIGFTSTSTVTFNGTPAPVVSGPTDGRLTVDVPAAAPSGPITVTNTAAPTGTVDSLVNFNPMICGITSTAPTYKHVIVIMDENHSYGDIIGSPSAPYINALASQCGQATNYRSISHPSLPEYIAATSGTPLSQLTPFISDCVPSASCESSANNIFQQISSWRSYAESMPSNCYKSNSGTYAPRHNPAVYYTDLSNCATNDVPLGTVGSSPLINDFQQDSTAPPFAWVTPNLCDDMHGTTGCASGTAAIIQAGDNWLKQWIPLITSTPTYETGDTAILLAWDEGEGPGDVGGENCAISVDPSCHVPMIVIAPSVRAGTMSAKAFNHYSLLKTSEDLLGVPELGSATTAASLAAAFNL
jgi:hypothetical protein